MRSKLLTGVAVLTIAAGTLASVGSASARNWGWHGRGFGWGAGAIAAGVVGGAVAAATSPLWAPVYYDYAPGYAYAPDYSYGYGPNRYGYRPNYGGYQTYSYETASAVSVAPGPVVAQGYGGRGDGAAYCEQRFRSYDPASGTYLGFDGLRHPCP